MKPDCCFTDSSVRLQVAVCSRDHTLSLQLLKSHTTGLFATVQSLARGKSA